MSLDPVNVAIVGLGTVGTGVARVLLDQPERIARRAGRPVVLRRAVVRNAAKSRDIQLPSGILTTDVAEVVNDREIQVALHLVGGIHPAREIMLDLLIAGKDVVTANKALLCEYGDELFAKARELGRTIAFEAAVAGGIPIIAAVGQSLAGNQILSISAILNGTSNYILTQMVRENWSYREALKRAQELGYAEEDPTLDVDGTDAAQKLVILTQLAFGVKAPLSSFPRQGIDTLELADLRYAAELGYTVKLLAVSRLVNGELEMRVQPTLVRQHTPLAEIHGAFNAIALVGDVVGETWYSGPGAGQMPTASAVIADLIDTIAGRTQITFPRLELWRHKSAPYALQPREKISSRFYLRFNVLDRPHVLADIADILGKSEISIASVIQHEAPEVAHVESGAKPVVPLVIMTHRTTEGNLQAAEQKLNQLSSITPPRVRMAVAD
ncbi:MAG: homoserine dehydrogenase [Planctomycetaceae bacterium]|nr:homoserine dehydrogenase [Planctomycetaceae bacterium]